MSSGCEHFCGRRDPWIDADGDLTAEIQHLFSIFYYLNMIMFLLPVHFVSSYLAA